MRGIAAFLLLHFLAVLLAPAWVVADFMVERDRIERELCVQRMVPDAQRTCHGECSLMKRLEKCNERERDLPFEIRAFRVGDMILDGRASALIIPRDGARPAWAIMTEEPREGHSRPPAPVPWC